MALFAQTQTKTVTFNSTPTSCRTCSGVCINSFSETWSVDHATLFGSGIMNGSWHDGWLDACPATPSDQTNIVYGVDFFCGASNDPLPGTPFPTACSGNLGLSLSGSSGRDTVNFQLQVNTAAFAMQVPQIIHFCVDNGLNSCDPSILSVIPLFDVSYTPDQSADLGPCTQCEAQAGAPINVMTGNVWIAQRDDSLPGLGGGLQLARIWNSTWDSNAPPIKAGIFGDGWTSTYEERLQSQTGGGFKYWSSSGAAWVFSFNSSTGVYTLTVPADVRAALTFDAVLNQYTLTMKDGGKRVFDANGRLLNLLDRNGNKTALAYDGSGRPSTVTDATGRSLTFSYSDPNNVNQVTAIVDAAGTVANYVYSPGAVLSSVRYADGSGFNFTSDASALITGVTDVNGKTIETHTYDSFRRGLTSDRANGVDHVSMQYNGVNASVLTDSNGNTTSYSPAFIKGKHYVSSVAGPGCASCGAVPGASYAYDTNANRTSSTDALGHATTYTYDGNANVTSTSLNVGGVPVNWSYTYNSFGEVLTATDPLGNVTTNTYDVNGNLLTTTTPSPGGKTAGSSTSFAYDSKGELTQVIDPLGHITKLTYTAAGLVGAITDPLNNVTSFQYDARGNRTAVTDALNHQTTFQYDSRNRLIKITKPDQGIVSYVYDARGRRVSVTDENSKTTQYAYDDADRLVSVTDANGAVTQYAYDNEGNLTGIKDPRLHTTSFSYDSQRRLTQTTFPSTKAETYAYDAASNLTSKTDRKGQVINYSYDELGRLTKQQYPDATSVVYTYDAASRLTQMQDPTGTYSLMYDNLSRLTQASTIYSFLAGKTFAVSYSYDAGSNRLGLTDPNGSSTSYTFDGLNRLASLKDFKRNSFTFSYDALGRTTTLARPNGVSSTYQYDAVSNLLSVLHQNGTATLDGALYAYDPAGNRIAKTNKLNNVTSNLVYDNLYQLTGVTQGTSAMESYTYDAVGNRLSAIGGLSYSYNASNELLAAGPASYTYDDNGNTLTKTDSSGTTAYAWDFENRLKSVTLPSGTSVTFKYDPLGRRIQKGGSIFVYDGANLIQESDQAGNLVARYIQGPGLDQPLAVYRGAASEFYDADGLGSITSLTTTSGSVNQSYIFDAFGNTSSTTGTFIQPFQYTGREWDAETGLYYYRARYYDPAAARFLSEDPIGFEDGINVYSYAGNNPVNFSDPSGLCSRTPCSVGVPLDSELRKVVDTMLGETSRNTAIGTNQYGDDQHGHVVGNQEGEVITEDVLNLEAYLIASTIINRANARQASWTNEVTRPKQYAGYSRTGKHLIEAMGSDNGSDLCTQLLRALTALNQASHNPEPGLTDFKAVVQGKFVRLRKGARRVAGTDFQYTGATW
ncbi:MAG TPA: RHS repeat-associated core domain-containing protein [Candidatus Saccharimonadales bacterium]|nr:RHS repeat-associated core domain-containing protein [Candidatus Saccharimonadales bacterium]